MTTFLIELTPRKSDSELVTYNVNYPDIITALKLFREHAIKLSRSKRARLYQVSENGNREVIACYYNLF